MTATDPFHRLERKVDDLTDAVTKLVLFEERQSVQAVSISHLTNRVESTEQKLAMWINRGVGVWAVVFVILTILKVFNPHL